MKKKQRTKTGKVKIRALDPGDYDAVVDIQTRSFPGIKPWTRAQFESQLSRFPHGQLCIEFDGRVVATSSTLILDLEHLSALHDFKEVSDDGFIGNHDPEGDTLYGIDIAVDPDFRGLRLARRLYEARKDLARRLNLRRFAIAGRMPTYHKHADRLSPEQYLKKVLKKEIRDPVITAQVANGFRALRVLENYLPSDEESGGHAVLMEWKNPDHSERPKVPGRGTVRVASVQYLMRSVASWDDFATQCEFFIDTASEYRSDFVLFPELLTNQLQALVTEDRPGKTARRLTEFTDRYMEFFSAMAIKHAVNVVAGSHLTVQDDKLYNVAYLFRRDGTHETQKKIHITPSEARWWGISPGDDAHVFDTDKGKVAILICYDVEFPELARIVTAKGARMLFVPYNTDIRSGYFRVRYCAHARCIENGVYAVLSGACGNLPMVEGADIHYAQSCILTPSDVAFARDAIAAEATPNVETMLIHDLDLDVLRRARMGGTVRPWVDRRLDLYHVSYGGPMGMKA